MHIKLWNYISPRNEILKNLFLPITFSLIEYLVFFFQSFFFFFEINIRILKYIIQIVI